MSRAWLEDVAMVDGRLARVIAVNEGNREITFEFIGSEPCPTCGRPDQVSINEGTPNWSSQVRQVSTCGEPS